MTHGFIRSCYRNEEFKHLVELPHYLIELVNTFYSIECVHLMKKPFGRETGHHWTMSVDHIINNC